MNVLLDNIIFAIQKSGGVSVVWFEFLKRLLNESEINTFFRDCGSGNLYRSKIDIPNESIIGNNSFPLVEKYFPINVRSDASFIYHPSYYRYCSNPNAINVTTVHDFTYEYYREGLAKWIHCWQKYRAIRHADAIVCISENTKSDLMRFLPDVDSNKLYVIYNGVSEDYYVIEGKADASLPFPVGSYVVFVGSRGGYKNFDLVIRTLAKSDYNLIIVGPQLSAEEEKRVRQYIPTSRYKSVGFLPNSELNIVYNCAAALVYPSSYEGFGLPVLEAQRAGCPVIAYNASSIPEVIGETPLLMSHLTEQELLVKLEMLKDKELVEEVINKGLLNSKRFSWDKMYQEYLELYKEVWKKIINNNRVI